MVEAVKAVSVALPAAICTVPSVVVPLREAFPVTVRAFAPAVVVKVKTLPLVSEVAVNERGFWDVAVDQSQV